MEKRFRPPTTAPVLAGVLVLALLATGCGRSGGPPVGRDAGARFQVVAAENFWGSIAAQLGGDRARVTSIIASPSTDPHSYEPTAQDARTMAGASMAIVNGLGYDNWASKLLEASPVSGRVVLNVGERLGLKQGDNPHQWYSPAHVHEVVDQIVAGFDSLDPADRDYFEQRRQTFLTRDLARYDELRRQLRNRYAGVAVGYSESIFAPLGEDLKLRLLTPTSFAKAISEGTEVTAADRRAVDAQADQRRIEVWVFNSQNVTPDVQRVNQLARERGIPIATVTETLTPASASFEQWQVAELEGLMHALHRATGR